MLKRLWVMLASVWAFVFLANACTKIDGPGWGDLFLAAAPLIAGLLAMRAGRWVAFGPAPARTEARPWKGPYPGS